MRLRKKSEFSNESNIPETYSCQTYRLDIAQALSHPDYR